MIVNRFTIIVDACVLHSVLKRNIIMSLAQEGLFSPREALFALDNMLNRFNNPQVDMDGLILWMEKEGMTEASKFLIRVLPE